MLVEHNINDRQLLALQQNLLPLQMECERVNVIEEVDAGHCRLRVEGHITVKVFGIGRLAERIIIESTLKTLRALPAITERWRFQDCCLWKLLA